MKVDAWRDPGLFQLFAQASSPQTVYQFKDFLINQIEVNLASRLTQDDLTAVLLDFDRAYEQAMQQPKSMALALTDAVAQGDWRLFFAARDGLAAVTLQDVKRVADLYLQRFNRNAALLSGRGSKVAIEWRPAPPLADQLASLVQRQTAVPGEALAAEPLALEARTRRWSPRTGLQLAWLDKRLPGNIGGLSITLRFAQPSDTHGRFGAAILGSLLSHGSAGTAQNTMSKGLAELNCQAKFEAGPQHVTIRLQAHVNNLPAALDLVAAAVRQPRWDAMIFERERARALSQVPVGGHEVGQSLSLMLARVRNTAYQWRTDDSRYEWVGAEGRNAWTQLSLDDLRTLHAELWGAGDVRVAAIGALDAHTLVAALDRAFRGWQPGRPYASPTSGHVAVPPQRHHARIVDRPNGVMQALQFLPMNRDHADRWPLELGLRMLAGSMGSRIWQRLREDQGISYDIRSIFTVPARGDRAVFGVVATYPSASQDRVLQALDQEVERARLDGFTQTELNRARAALLGERRAQLANDESLLAILDMQLALGVGFEAWDRNDKLIAAASLAQVNLAFLQHVGSQQWVLLTAADTEGDRGLGQSR